MSADLAGKRVGFLELFFDLVFVFAVTQLVQRLHADHTLAGWGRAGVLLWLVWWAWSQYAWAGNAIDVDRRPVRLALLVATGTMLLAAAAIPTAFDDGGPRFAIAYAAVRLVGLGLYWLGLRGDVEHRAALRTYLPVALVSPILVVGGGFVASDARWVPWVLAIAVDVTSVIAAGRGEFRVDPAHFAERHGLIVIIALGESIIVIGAAASEAGLAGAVTGVVIAALAVVAGLWWCYFDWVHAAAESRLASEPDHRLRGHLARDLFTLGHLPIVAGTMVLAAAIEEVLLHPDAALEPFAATALAVGPALYLSGFVLGNLRARGELLTTRLIGLLAVLAVVGLGRDLEAGVVVGLVAVVIAGVALSEARTHTPA